jgi:6-phosphogluconate dehydrogenase
MKLAMIGLGKMGMNMARRLMQGNHEVVAYDLNEKAVQQISAEGASGAASLQAVVEQLSTPRIVWIMLPAGKPVEQTISHLSELLGPKTLRSTSDGRHSIHGCGCQRRDLGPGGRLLHDDGR